MYCCMVCYIYIYKLRVVEISDKAYVDLQCTHFC